jgi:hypothetical protein
MADTNETRQYDKRVAARYIRKGLLDEKEFKKHLDALPDLEEQAEEIESEFEPTVAPRPSTSPAAEGEANEE